MYSASKPSVPLLPSVGELLRRLRQQRHLSQRELAARSGISRAVLSAIENDRQRPDIEKTRRLARALDCHPVALLVASIETG